MKNCTVFFVCLVTILISLVKMASAQLPPFPHTTINASILDIDYTNPLPENENIKDYPASNWPQNICENSLWLSGSSPKEWGSILDAKNSIDNNAIVGVSGIAINPHTSGADVWFTHPFGSDWNFDVAWKTNQNFDFLQNPIIKTDAETNAVRDKATSKDLQGVIHVEMDSAFVPPFFRAKEGNSVAIFGRWIVDCGHDNYQTEIHPPLLFVKAVGQLAIGGGSSTESTVIGRPFMVAQDFDDGESLRDHLAKQTNELLQLQLTGPFVALFHYEAIPNILPNSFSGTHLMSFNIRPPREALENEHLYLSYHFTVRTGVTVSLSDVNDGQGTIRVNVLFDDVNYIPPQLPPAIEDNISIETIKGYNDDLGKALWIGQFGAAANPFVAIALQNGVKTNRYDIPLYTEQNDITVSMNELRANPTAGIVVDDSQIYPIRGSMKVEWVYKEPETVEDICTIHPSPLTSDVNEVSFQSENLDKINSQLITITNPTDAPIQLGKLSLDGTNPERFALQYKTIILLRHGMTQPSEDCSNTSLPPNSSCSFRVVVLPGPNDKLDATIQIPGGGPCNLKIPIRVVKVN